MEDKNILTNFQDEQQGNGDKKPGQAFSQLMLRSEQVKTNVENMLKDQIASSLGDLDIIVKKFI
jgi:hypothetical protein